MEDVRVLVVDPCTTPSMRCHKGTCALLVPYVRSVLSAVTVQELIGFSVSTQKIPTPDLIIVLAANSHESRRSLLWITEKWPDVPVLGVFCPSVNTLDQIEFHTLHRFEDLIFCPFQLVDVGLRLHRALHTRLETISTPTSEPHRTTSPLKSLIGKSKSFVQVLESIPLFSKCDTTVLVQGETGTGKELFARAIHENSYRRNGAFLPINCGALPEQLFENELFGHVKGAYTDASTEQKGLLFEADGGTIVLDEVDTLSPQAQVKLLRFLQEFEYRPLGSGKSVKADVRIIACANTPLSKQVAGKAFREDLYYRLNILSISIPPLRKRIEDIPLLAEYFVKKYGKVKRKNQKTISSEARQKLMNYEWPGNIRELENVIQRALALHDKDILQVEHFDLPNSSNGDASFDRPLQMTKRGVIDQFERSYLVNLLSEYSGNVSRAAKAAGKERRTFQRLLRKHDLDRSTFSRDEKILKRGTSAS